MQRDLDIKCSNKHSAFQICVGENCKKQALICSEKTCQFSSQHQGCLISASIPEVIKKLLNKGKNYQIIEKSVINFYNQIIKIAQHQKSEFIKKIQTPYSELKGEKKKLYDIFKYKHASQIYPPPINNLIRRIDKQEEEIVFTINKKIKIQTQRSIKQIFNILQSTKQYIYKQISAKVDYQFSKNLHHQNFQIIRNGNATKVTKGQQHRFALITPSIQSNSQPIQRIRIKVIRDKNFSLLLGLAQVNILTQNKFSHDTKRVQNGLYICGCNTGTIYNSSDMQQNLTKGKFRFIVEDVVQIQINKETMIMTLRNLNKNLQQTLKFTFQNENDLYFCVCAHSVGTQIEILQND